MTRGTPPEPIWNVETAAEPQKSELLKSATYGILDMIEDRIKTLSRTMPWVETDRVNAA